MDGVAPRGDVYLGFDADGCPVWASQLVEVEIVEIVIEEDS